MPIRAATEIAGISDGCTARPARGCWRSELAWIKGSSCPCQYRARTDRYCEEAAHCLLGCSPRTGKTTLEPESGQVATAADPNNQVPDGANLRLVVAAGKMHLFLLHLVTIKTSTTPLVRSSARRRWGRPVKLPIDGPRSTKSPFALAVDSHGWMAAMFDANTSELPRWEFRMSHHEGSRR